MQFGHSNFTSFIFLPLPLKFLTNIAYHATLLHTTILSFHCVKTDSLHIIINQKDRSFVPGTALKLCYESIPAWMSSFLFSAGHIEYHTYSAATAVPSSEPESSRLRIINLQQWQLPSDKDLLHHPFPVSPNPKNESKRIHAQTDLLHLPSHIRHHRPVQSKNSKSDSMSAPLLSIKIFDFR